MLEEKRRELGEKFLEVGLTEETLRLSQELDILIIKEQTTFKEEVA